MSGFFNTQIDSRARICAQELWLRGGSCCGFKSRAQPHADSLTARAVCKIVGHLTEFEESGVAREADRVAVTVYVAIPRTASPEWLASSQCCLSILVGARVGATAGIGGRRANELASNRAEIAASA
jgi:hypothetical protein